MKILAKFSNMSLLSPFCHLENRMEMLLPNFLAYSKKERLGQMIKHVYFFVCLFKTPEFSLVTKYSQCAMLLSQYRDRKILKCWYGYYVLRLKHAALQIMTGVQKFQNSKYLSIHWYDAQ